MSAAFRIPPYPEAIIHLLTERGHQVSVRQIPSGSLRYRIDAGRWLLAIEMDLFYARTYEKRAPHC
jgi:hypothetical protein